MLKEDIEKVQKGRGGQKRLERVSWGSIWCSGNDDDDDGGDDDDDADDDDDDDHDEDDNDDDDDDDDDDEHDGLNLIRFELI